MHQITTSLLFTNDQSTLEKSQALNPALLPPDTSFLFNAHTTNKALYQKSMQQVIQSITGFLTNRNKPFSGITPEALLPLFENIDLDSPSDSFENVLEELREVYTNHAIAFHDTKYMAHLNCPVAIPAIAAEAIISSINSSLDTWDQSAGGTFIEQKVLKWTGKRIGFDAHCDGIFTSGGTQSNLMAVLLMREYHLYQKLGINARKNGLPPQASQFRIFCSEHSHFSLKNGAVLLGLGEKAIIPVKADDQFRMDINALDQAIRKERKDGNIPIGIVGTAGTTDYGSIDPLNLIYKIAKKHDLWFHVDAAVGGGLITSQRRRHLLNGIEKANSVTIDYHKTFYQPVSCSSFIVRDHRDFSMIRHYADYLNPKEHRDAGIPNQVDKSLQTTRRFDGLKMWMTLRTIGPELLGQYYDTSIDKTKMAAQLIAEDTDFELLHHPTLNCIVFRYQPKKANKNNDWDNINAKIRQAIFKNGSAVIAGTKLHGKTYLKFTILNPLVSQKDILYVLKLIKNYGEAQVQF